MASHVIAYRSLELLFGTHTFNFNCFFDDFYCAFTQIRCLSRVLQEAHFHSHIENSFLFPSFLKLLEHIALGFSVCVHLHFFYRVAIYFTVQISEVVNIQPL